MKELRQADIYIYILAHQCYPPFFFFFLVVLENFAFSLQLNSLEAFSTPINLPDKPCMATDIFPFSSPVLAFVFIAHTVQHSHLLFSFIEWKHDFLVVQARVQQPYRCQGRGKQQILRIFSKLSLHEELAQYHCLHHQHHHHPKHGFEGVFCTILPTFLCASLKNTNLV